MKNKPLLWLTLSVLFLVLAGLAGLTIKSYFRDKGIPPHHLIGNRDSNAKALKEKGFPFSFLVIGDTHNSSRATALMEKALKERDASFMIILGDIVSGPDIRDHLFFLKHMTEEINPPFPVFLVPGNHDIDYSLDKNQEKDRVTPEIYDSLYGARDFHFVFNDCLFVICGIDLRNQAGYLDYLRDTLSRKIEGKRHIFIFMHNPPAGVGIPASFPLPAQEGFFSLLKTYKVTACFFGDYHGYWRGQRDGTTLIVSGGGGAIKQWQPMWGRFHHLLKITVDKDSISEGILVLRGEANDLTETWNKWTFIHLFSTIERYPWTLYAFFLLTLFCGIFSATMFVRVMRRRQSSDSQKCSHGKV